MAGGGHYKGSSGGNGGGRGRPSAVILLLAFGAALVGVMVVHKLRERRIFNLLVQEKDRDLLSLQLLFQKEREHNSEMKRKAEEMKAKMYSLRTQKMELDRRLLEMQSTIDSLKDEQKMMESTLEEKQNEIRMLREETTDSGHENLQVMTFMESLKQKESEIEDLKHRLELPARVWSVSTDDPSKPLVNLTSTRSLNQKEDTRDYARGREGNQEHESTSSTDGLNTMKGEDAKESKSTDFREKESEERAADGAEGKIGTTAAIYITGRDTQKPEILQEDSRNGSVSGEVNKEASQYTVTSGSQGAEEISSDVSKVIINRGRQEQQTILTREPRKLEDLQGDQNKELQATTEGVMKLEIQDDLRSGTGSRSKGKHGHLSRSKGKKWRMLTRNRLLEKNLNSEIDGVVRRRRDRARSREEGKTSSEGKIEGEEGERDENTSLVKNEMDSADDKLLKGVAKENAVEVKIASNDEMQEKNKVADKEEIDAANADSTTDMEDNKDEYKDEREESEF
ncbi:hypothetical protein SLEP1_g9772 [Rubroshorea leprosula]|uniref:Micronuclear linker histone polyprotein-like protein n=1 Tax=Rubroshorea leprosula TaxID=152421 RepID=A0AAV5I5Z0_9ROSI|nr:hypothetical protein SLEP1_g9772 [Rubroshorea leprosula]